jgi:hypothetical protein
VDSLAAKMNLRQRFEGELEIAKDSQGESNLRAEAKLNAL